MRIVILGGGIAGLIAAHVLKDGHDVTIIEAGKSLGGNFNAGGLKYIRVTVPMMNMLSDLGVPFQTYTPRGKVILDSGMHPWPPWGIAKPVHEPDDGEVLISGEVIRLIQRIHWLKTRGSLDGFTTTCMNDPLGNGADPALGCDHAVLVDRLIQSIRPKVAINTSSLVTNVYMGNVECTDGGRTMFDRLITTIPLPVAAKIIPIGQQAKPTHHGIAVVNVKTAPAEVERFRQYKWDYCYTPLDPLVSRLSNSNGLLQAEAPYHLNSHPPTAKDFAANGWQTDGQAMHMPGHLVPMPANVNWPVGIIPLGRFAQWDSRMTVERVLDRAIEIRESL